MTALGRLRGADDCATVTAFKITLTPGLDPMTWSQSEPARSLGVVPENGGVGSAPMTPGQGITMGYMAQGVNGSAALQVIQKDQRVVSAEIAGTFEDRAHAPASCPNTSGFTYDWTPPGRGEVQLPGYVPKTTATGTNLTWDEKFAAAFAPPAPAAQDPTSGFSVPVLLLGIVLLVAGARAR